MNKKLGFGCMRLPAKGILDSSIDLEQVKAMFDIFLSKGFTYFDTAYMYHGGKSEVAIREALVKRYPRDSYTITDKLPLMMLVSKGQMEKTFNTQLERLGVDYIDYYWIHALNQHEYSKAQKWDAFGFIKNLKDEGKVRHIGFSFHDKADVLDKILTEHPEVEYVQLQLNYLDWEDENVESRKCYEVATKHNKSVIVMEPVKGGKLASLPSDCEQMLKKLDNSMSIASWAIRYVASLPNVFMVLSGMSNLEQAKDNISYMQDFKPLNDREIKVIETVSKILRGREQIPCTSCRYCHEGCPKDIAIPEYFNLYNKKDDVPKEELVKEYNKIVESGRGKASDCIKCGHCETMCPQHIKIRDNLDIIADFFEN